MSNAELRHQRRLDRQQALARLAQRQQRLRQRPGSGGDDRDPPGEGVERVLPRRTAKP